MRFAALIALVVGFAGVASVAQAQPAAPPNTPKAVVELFTSQGCSSCPAADALLARLADRDDVVAISLSVDYWDYLGWKDTLASAKFTERQRAYAKVLGNGMVYTPQMVVNGTVHVNGADERKVLVAIEKTGKGNSGPHVPVRLSSVDGKLVVEVGSAPGDTAAKEATVWLAVISPTVEVPITRGENKGKTITYTNVVRELMPIGMWSGKPMTVQLQRHSIMHAGTTRCAVLVQQGHAGPIVGAAMIKNF